MNRINVNNYVYVHLTEDAIQSYLENDKLFWEEAKKQSPRLKVNTPTREEFDLWHKKQNGFYKFQLWNFMRDFGNMFDMGVLTLYNH